RDAEVVDGCEWAAGDGVERRLERDVVRDLDAEAERRLLDVQRRADVDPDAGDGSPLPLVVARIACVGGGEVHGVATAEAVEHDAASRAQEGGDAAHRTGPEGPEHETDVREPDVDAERPVLQRERPLRV